MQLAEIFEDGVTLAKNRVYFLNVQVPSKGKIIQFDLQTKNRERAMKWAKFHVEKVQKDCGETVFWSFRGENILHYGTESLCPKPLKRQVIQIIKDLFEWDE